MTLIATTLEEASLIADQAFARMRKEGVPPTPNNYAVWYAHVSGHFPDLTRAMDILLSNNQPFSDDRCADLYRRFIGIDSEAKAVRDMGQKLQGALEGVLASLETAGADASRYGETLTRLGGQMGLAKSLEQLREMVRSVAAETDQMAERNRALHDQLSDSTSRIEEMRRDLENVRREAMTDALTGLANRKQFDVALRDSAAGAMERDRPLALLMIDIDHFKKFNDTHGHVTGDQVLKLVARTLAELSREGDTAARYGGEEFSIIMPDMPIRDAVVVAERIRGAVASRQIVKRTTSEKLGSITLSVGVATYQLGESLSRLIQRADAALYRAKNTGRNKVLADADDISRAA